MLNGDMGGQNAWAEACFKQYMATTLYYYRGLFFETLKDLVGYIKAN